MRREHALGAIVLVLVVLVIGVLSEVLLRLSGHTPWQPLEKPNEPVMLQPDTLLGWRNQRGHYRYPPYTPDGQEIRVSILEDGRRASGPDDLTPPGDRFDGRDQLVFLGGSLVFGWAVSDEETLPWKLQAELSGLKVLNYGTGGYGTYQSLLNLERLLPELEAPKLVVYGLYDGHEPRNVATWSWLSVLAWSSRRGHVELPYATVEAGSLVRHPAVSTVRFPLRDHLATSLFFERRYNDWLDGVGSADRLRSGREVTGAILRELQATCERHDLDLFVAILQAHPRSRQHYGAFLSEQGIPGVDCAVKPRPELQVEGEGHPTGEVHTRWADCVARALAENGLATPLVAPGSAERPRLEP